MNEDTAFPSMRRWPSSRMIFEAPKTAYLALPAYW